MTNRLKWPIFIVLVLILIVVVIRLIIEVVSDKGRNVDVSKPYFADVKVKIED